MIKRYTLVGIMLFLMACNTPRKLVLSGEYDWAIEKLVNKLRRNPNKDENVILLERAYFGAQKQDLDRIDFLKKEGNENNWVEIASRYQHIKQRQELIRPLMPLRVGKLSRNTNIQFIDVDNQIINSKQKAAEFYYNSGLQKLQSGGIMNARSAFADFQQVKGYNNASHYPSLDSLLNESHFQGEVFALFKIRNNSNAVLPKDFEMELRKISLQDLNSEWIHFDVNDRLDLKYQYHVVANIKLIDVGPEQWKEKEYEETKLIQDGWDYVLDAKGNVKKDSLGNDIKKPKMKTIRCKIKEVQQTKAATINAVVDYMDLRSKQLIGSYPVKADAVFQNYAAKAIGNQDALSDATRAKLGNQPLPFPTDLQLISQAGQTLKPLIKQVLAEHRNLVQN